MEKQKPIWNSEKKVWDHVCPCGQHFIGHKSKDYCSYACKKHYNNEEAREKTDLVRNDLNSIKKNGVILHKHHGNSDKPVEALISEILKDGFDFSAPIKRCVHSVDGLEYFVIGKYAYRKVNDKKLIIIKSLK